LDCNANVVCVVKAVELSVPAIAVQVTLSVDSSQRTQRAKVQLHFVLERTSKESAMFSHVLRGEPPKDLHLLVGM
jgi:hypothetical protein